MLTLVFTGVGLLFLLLALPLIRRRVPPNGLYGVRIPATMADERVWYEVNARSGRDLLIMGAALVVVALTVWMLGWPIHRQVMGLLSTVLAAMLIIVIRAFSHASSLQRGP